MVVSLCYIIKFTTDRKFYFICDEGIVAAALLLKNKRLPESKKFLSVLLDVAP